MRFFLIIFFSLYFSAPKFAYAQVTVGVSKVLPNLNPYAPGIDTEALNFYSRPLVRPGISNAWECLLCEEIPSPDNGSAKINKRGRNSYLISTWKIRKNLNWSDGKAITNEDVIFTWKVLRGLADAGYNNHPLLFEVDEIKNGPDAKSFEITHIGLSSDFAKISNFFLLPSHLEKKIWDACAEKAPCYLEQSLYRTAPNTPGLYNGPYTPRDAPSADSLKLIANPTFTLGPKAKIKEIVVKTFSNTGDNAAALANFDLILPGALDTLSALNLQRQISTSKLKESLRFHYPESDRIELLMFNTRNPVLADTSIRQAISKGLNRLEVLNSTFSGAQRIVNSIFDQPWWPALQPKIAPDFSIEQAKKLLENEGWHSKDDEHRMKESQTLSLEITIPSGDRIRAQLSKAIASNLTKLGIKSSVKEVSKTEYLRSTIAKAEFRDAVMVSWDLNQGTTPKSILHSKEIPNYSNQYYGQNISGWRNNKVDEQLEDLEASFNPEVRSKIIGTLITELNTEYPHIPIYFALAPSIQSQRIRGYIPTTFATPASGYSEKWNL